jgi:hypothetical protein
MLGIRKEKLQSFALVRCPVCEKKILLNDLLRSACEHFRGFNFQGAAIFQATNPNVRWRAFIEVDCPICGQRVFLRDIENTACRHFVSVDREAGEAIFEHGIKAVGL